jgi:hypothetical protein
MPTGIASLALFASTIVGMSAGNFAVDLMGSVDQRQYTWGRADSHTWTVQFNPPAGYRTRILRIRGDLVAYPKILAGDSPIETWQSAGVLVSYHTTAPDAGGCSPCSGNTLIYYQGVLFGASRERIPYDVQMDQLLESDNKLIVKVAEWLNTYEKPIHIEPTFTIEYRYESSSL